MSQKSNLKPIALAVGAAIATSLGAMSAANADTSPFGMTSLSSGYMSADVMTAGEGKCGEGKCGGSL